MVNAQEWLNKKNQDKEEVTEIDLAELIEEEKEFDRLEIKDFSNLTKIKDADNGTFDGITKVVISNCEQLEDINDLLRKFPNLTYLDCSSNDLTDLDVSNCLNIEKIYCQNNRLTNITLPKNTGNLKVLALLNNNLSKISIKGESDDQEPKEGLSALSNFTNLERLYLGNFTEHEDLFLRKYDGNKISENKDVYNKFNDSLKSLEDLGNLKVLDISNTNVDGDLEELLKNNKELEEIYCSSNIKEGKEEGKKWGVNSIETKLKEDSNFYFLNNRFIKKYEAQGWLNKKYPKNKTCQNRYDKENYKKNKREEIEKLDIKEWGLEGSLNLSDFVSLKELDCSNNLLQELILSKEIEKKVNLEKLYCSHNKLSSLGDFQYNLLDPKKLTVLSISDNKFSKNDLIIFRKFTNLEILHVGGNNSEITALQEEIDELINKIKWNKAKRR